MASSFGLKSLLRNLLWAPRAVDGVVNSISNYGVTAAINTQMLVFAVGVGGNWAATVVNPLMRRRVTVLVLCVCLYVCTCMYVCVCVCYHSSSNIAHFYAQNEVRRDLS